MSVTTKESFVDAYLALLDEKDITKISIIDLTQKSQASRQTFYYYFKNLDGLIEWAFENETNKACEKLVHGETWPIASKYYITLLDKLTVLIRSSLYTSKSTFIYSLLSQSVEKFVREYVKISSGNQDKVTEFFYTAVKHLVVGLVFDESRKDEPDYNCVIEFVKQGLLKS